MSNNIVNPGPSQADLDAYLDQLTALHQALIAADADATDEGENEIFELSNLVEGMITTVDEEGLAANAAALQALGPNIDDVNKDLQDAQKEINTWVNDVKIAETVTAALDAAVNTGVKIFGMIPK